MLLSNKNAIIYGAGGSLGSTIARALAAEGATVFLAGRSPDPLQKVKDAIARAGGSAEIAEVDAMDEKSVNRHIDDVAAKKGSVDILFNLINLDETQNIPLINMALADFVRPVTKAMTTHFLTATAAGRIMVKQGSGVILSLTATPGGVGYPLVGGFGPACCAMEGFSRDLASELGPSGVRVVNIRSAGSPDSKVFADAIIHSGELWPAFIKKLQDDTMLKKLPLMKDIANVAVFLSSGMAASITGVTIDVTAGTTSGLNYTTIPIPLR